MKMKMCTVRVSEGECAAQSDARGFSPQLEHFGFGFVKGATIGTSRQTQTDPHVNDIY